MKITYKFAKETVEIEVDEKWGSILVDLDKDEGKNNRTETRRHCSLDALNLDGNLIPSKSSVWLETVHQSNAEQLHAAIGQLKPQQRDLIYNLFFYGVSNKEYARRCGVAPAAITQRKETALKALKKFLKDF